MPRNPSVKQFSFAGGEISPRLFGRTDLQRYRQSLQTCLNFVIEPTGCATNRAGTKYLREVKDSADEGVRLLPFVALNGQAYALEFGDGYFRVHSLGGTVFFPTSDSGEHTAGDDTDSLTDYNKRWQTDQWVGATVTNVTDGSSGTVTANTSNNITATLSGGTDDDWDTDDEYTLSISPAKILEIETPYNISEVAMIKWAQQNDVMVLVHPNHKPHVLQRYADDDWRLEPFSVIKNIVAPEIVSVPNYTADPDFPADDWFWCVTAIDRNGVESLRSGDNAQSRDTSQLYPTLPKFNVLFNPSGDGNLPKGYNIYRSRGVESTGANDQYWGFVGYHEHIGAQTDQQSWMETNELPDYSDAPPTGRDPFQQIVSATTPGAQETQFFTIGGDPLWEAADASGVGAYQNLYTYRIIGTLLPGEWVTFQLEARADGDPEPWTIYDTVTIRNDTQETTYPVVYRTVTIPATFFDNPPWKRFGVRIIDQSATLEHFLPWYALWNESITAEESTETYPASVCFYEQRLVFGGFTHNGQLLRFSKTGDIYNFDQSIPLKADDSFDLVVASLRLDAIRQLVPHRAMLMLTAGAEWLARGAEGGPLTPESFDLKLQTAYGASDAVQALPIGDAILYLTERGRKLREMLVDPYGDQNRSRDLSVMTEHLFRDYTPNDLQYADVPYQIVWMTRADGTLLGLTYVREHDVYAWHRHSTGGIRTDGAPRDAFESVCCVPEGQETSIYVIVRRTIDGSTVRYVEKFASRRFLESPDGIFLDSALTFDGRNTGSTQLRLEAITGTHDGGTHATTLTDSSASWAVDEWVGNTIKNTTDNSEGTAQSNTNDDIVLDDLTGGTDDQWENGDAYEIEPTWVAQEKMILHADTAATFVAGDVGTEFALRRQVIDGLTVTDYEVRVRVTALIDGQNVEVTPHTPVPSQLQTVYTDDWGQAFNEFSGLDHLEGETIGVLVDGATHDDVTVASGEITLDSGIFAERLQAGIRYNSDLVTMPLDVRGDEGTVRSSKKLIPTVYLEVDDYRGLWAGHSLDHLREVQQRAVEEAYATISPENVLVAVRPASRWSRSVNVAVRQVDPLPVTVLSVIAGVKVGGNQ